MTPAHTRSNKHPLFVLPAFAALGLLTSCAVGPDFKRPDVAAPAAFKTATEAEKAEPVLASTWWTLFNDPEISRFAEETLRSNLDIRAAMARVDQARALTRSAEGDYSPQVALNPTAARTRSATTDRTTNRFSLPLVASYEVDVWGRLRRQSEFYRATEAASAADFAVVLQTALADVTQGYVNLRLFDTQRLILEKALALYRRQLELTQIKFKSGLALQTDVLKASTSVDSAINQLAENERLRAKQEHALAVLLGRAPSELTLERGSLVTAVPVIPAGLPSELLTRRPDVASAERSLAAANAQVGVAKANFFPSLSLTGAAGFESVDLQNLTEWGNRAWSFGPSLSLPIFQGGKLNAALKQAKARYEEGTALYRTTVLGAFRDVEDQLSDLHLLADEATTLEATLVSAREYSRLTELQYQQGLTTYLQVIDANQTLLTNELSAARTQAQRLAATILLIKALGGGWDPQVSPSLAAAK